MSFVDSALPSATVGALERSFSPFYKALSALLAHRLRVTEAALSGGNPVADREMDSDAMAKWRSQERALTGFRSAFAQHPEELARWRIPTGFLAKTQSLRPGPGGCQRPWRNSAAAPGGADPRPRVQGGSTLFPGGRVIGFMRARWWLRSPRLLSW
jgi:hypothetical protein